MANTKAVRKLSVFQKTKWIRNAVLKCSLSTRLVNLYLLKESWKRSTKLINNEMRKRSANSFKLIIDCNSTHIVYKYVQIQPRPRGDLLLKTTYLYNIRIARQKYLFIFDRMYSIFQQSNSSQNLSFSLKIYFKCILNFNWPWWATYEQQRLCGEHIHFYQSAFYIVCVPFNVSQTQNRLLKIWQHNSTENYKYKMK